MYLVVLDPLGHLWVKEVFLDDNLIDEINVLQRTFHFSFHLFNVKIDILAVKINHSEDSLHRNFLEINSRVLFEHLTSRRTHVCLDSHLSPFFVFS